MTDPQSLTSMSGDAMHRVLAKHRQARKHLEAFDKAVRDFIGDDPCRTEGRLSDDHMEYVFTAHDVKTVPEEISLLAGDVVHNCRACLDHLAWEISMAPDGKTSFPILRSPSKDGPEITGGISAAHQQALDAVQPYKISPGSPDDALLEILRKLDNDDKHKVVLASVSSIDGNVHGMPRHYAGRSPETEYEWGALEEGGRVATFRCSEPSPHMTISDFKLIPSVSLTGISSAKVPAEARDLLTTLHKLVAEIVATFDPL
ncbi:MAG TPA: hypothetical protein VMA72_14150 [Streptosporangiaceae bacterium]|nr:hypothetical protein [Streptosporangiaceae bacterium]